MNQATFSYYMGAVKALDDGTDYRRGYEYGLRRHFHGTRFGEDTTIARMQERDGDLAEGIRDGLAGRAPKWMAPATAPLPNTAHP